MGWAYADAEKLQLMVFLVITFGILLTGLTGWFLYRLIRRFFRKKW